MPITALRITRKLPMPEVTPSTTMICRMPWPTMVMIVSNSNRPGNDIQASTKRCTRMSSLPPTKPATPPTSSATSVLSRVAAKPTPSEVRAPYTSRLNTSRPSWSVPSR